MKIELCKKNETGECEPFKCEVHPCLFQERKEFKVHSKTLEENVETICIVGHLMKSLCDITNRMEMLKKEDGKEGIKALTESITYMTSIGEMMRTIKASSVLAFYGYYRSALDLLRSSIEVLVYSLYFDSFEKEQGRKWLEGQKGAPNFRVAFNKLKQVLPSPFHSEIDNAYGKLNKYVHAHPKGFSLSQADCTGCPVDGLYTKKLLGEWLNYYQKIMRWIFTYYYVACPELEKDEHISRIYEWAEVAFDNYDP